MLLLFKGSFSDGTLALCVGLGYRPYMSTFCENDRLCLSILTVVIRSRYHNLMIRCPFYDFVIHLISRPSRTMCFSAL